MLEAPLQADPETIAEGVNLVWVLVATFLVFFMHAGFGMLESGQVRSKNVANQLTKNVLTWGVGVIAYFFIGAGVSAAVAGLTTGGGIDGAFSYINGGSTVWANWLFGAAFSMVAASIVSGAVAERAQLGGYLVFTVFVGALIYPVATGLTWGGGFLAELGFQDFAGAAVVHMTGVCGLVAAYVIGPRVDKYAEDGSTNVIPGHSLPYVILGTLILAFGWYGFNVGTAVEVFQVSEGGELALADYTYAGRVALNTALVMGAGSIGAALVGYARQGKVDTLMTANGLLAGLVSVCSIAAVSSWTGTLVVGLIAGIQVPLVFELLERVGIDDVCAVFPVHGSAGVLSALAYPFVDTTSAFSVSQLVSQIAGVVVLAIWAAGITLAIYGALKALGWDRVSREEEIEGLDAAEHGIETYPEFGKNFRDEVSTPGHVPDGVDGTPAADGGEVSDDD